MTGSLREARVRIAEIRAENHQGDVSASDIWWLCEVADKALDRALVCSADNPRHPSTVALDRVLKGRTP